MAARPWCTDGNRPCEGFWHPHAGLAGHTEKRLAAAGINRLIHPGDAHPRSDFGAVNMASGSNRALPLRNLTRQWP